MRRNPRKKVAIIGSGIAGLECALNLNEFHDVEIIDKGMNVGGRIATRLTNRLVKAAAFDHGAQYFTAKSEDFKKSVSKWIDQKVVALWEGKMATLCDGKFAAEERTHERYVGTPQMRTFTEVMAQPFAVTRKRIIGMENKFEKWTLYAEGENNSEREQLSHEYDAVIIAIPPAQAADLLNFDEKLRQECLAVKMAPCWATMLEFEERLPIEFDGIFVKDSALSWIARDSSKPGRAKGERWVLHANPEWSEQHLEEDATEIATRIIDEFLAATRISSVKPAFSKSHRWRYALPIDADEPIALHPADTSLVVCGDWCHGARVEGAFLSGRDAAKKIGSELAKL